MEDRKFSEKLLGAEEDDVLRKSERYQETIRLLEALSETSDLRLTMSLSTDGVAIYKWSSKSLWRVWLCINELAPTIRLETDISL